MTSVKEGSWGGTGPKPLQGMGNCRAQLATCVKWEMAASLVRHGGSAVDHEQASHCSASSYRDAPMDGTTLRTVRRLLSVADSPARFLQAARPAAAMMNGTPSRSSATEVIRLADIDGRPANMAFQRRPFDGGLRPPGCHRHRKGPKNSPFYRFLLRAVVRNNAVAAPTPRRRFRVRLTGTGVIRVSINRS